MCKKPSLSNTWLSGLPPLVHADGVLGSTSAHSKFEGAGGHLAAHHACPPFLCQSILPCCRHCLRGCALGRSAMQAGCFMLHMQQCAHWGFQMQCAVHSLGAGRMQAVCLSTPCCSLHVCMQLIRGFRQMDRTVLVRINQELTPDAKLPSGSFCVLTKSLGKPALMCSSLSATSAARQSPCSTAAPRWPCRPSCSLRRCAAAGCLAAVCPRLTSSTGSIRLLAAL